MTTAATPPGQASPSEPPPREAVDQAKGRPRALLLVVGACTLLTLALLWGFRYLPGVDLPQHAAQATIALHWDDPSSGYARHLVENPRAPYRVPSSLVTLLARATSVPTALAILLTLGVLGVPVATWLLVRDVG